MTSPVPPQRASGRPLAEESPRLREGPSRWQVLTAVGVGTFMATLDSSIVNVSLPTIGAQFGITIAIAQWVPLAYLITVAALLLSAGRLADLLGRSRTYQAGLVVFMVGSLACGFAPSASALIGSRVLQALGAALIMATAQALLTDAFPAEERGRAMGFGGMIVSVGLMTGPPLGGLISGSLGWRWIFYVNLPVGLIGVLLTAKALRALPRAEGKLTSFDIPGALALGAFMVCLCLGLTHGPTRGWHEGSTVALLVAAPVLLGLFLVRQATADAPMLRLPLFLNGTFSSAAGSALLSFSGQFPIFLFLPFYLEGILGYSEKSTGLTVFIVPLFTAALAWPGGRLADAIGTRIPTVAGMLIRATAYAFFLSLGLKAPFLHVALPLAFLAFGNAAFAPANNSALMGAVPPADRGIAASMSSTMRSLGMVIGAATATAIAAAQAISVHDSHGGSVLDAAQNPEAFVKGFHGVLIFSICCALAAAVAAAARPNDAGQAFTYEPETASAPGGGEGGGH